jgi:hypothetical protein
MIGSRLRATRSAPKPAPPTASPASSTAASTVNGTRPRRSRLAGAALGAVPPVERSRTSCVGEFVCTSVRTAERRCSRSTRGGACGAGLRLSLEASPRAEAPLDMTAPLTGRLRPRSPGGAARSASPAVTASTRPLRGLAFAGTRSEVPGVAAGADADFAAAGAGEASGAGLGADRAGSVPVGAGEAAGGAAAAGGGDGSGSGAGAGGAAGAGGGLGALRGGRRPSGSMYESSEASLTPRWTYGRSCSGSPEGPGAAIGSPSATRSPRLTRSAPRWMSDALCSPVAIVTVRPCVGTSPANVTSPETGARTAGESPVAMSIPRCWPPAYLSLPTENSWRTGPSAGHAHAHAEGPAANAQTSATPKQTTHLVARRANIFRR